MKKTGVVILIIGILMTMITSIKFIAMKNNTDPVLNEFVIEENSPVYWSPLAGLLFISVGGAILILTRKKLDF